MFGSQRELLAKLRALFVAIAYTYACIIAVVVVVNIFLYLTTIIISAVHQHVLTIFSQSVQVAMCIEECVVKQATRRWQ